MIRRLAAVPDDRNWIRMITDLDPVREEQTAARLERLLQKPDTLALGVFREAKLTGIFVFLILAAEQYMEMLMCLSRREEAYEETARYLEEHYPGWQADLVFDPANTALKNTFRKRDAEFFTEQQRMRLAGLCPFTETDGIEPLSAMYRDRYCAIHDKDLYWTGEKTAAAPERFDIFLAVERGAVCGYIDVTNCYEENEPVSLFVLPEYRRRGWGRKLLAAAIQRNAPKAMSLLVDVDNIPALRLYESAGFVKVPAGGSQTATWHIPVRK